MSLYLTAFIHSKPGMANVLKPLLLAMVKGSRTEEACIQYNLHQSIEDENKFIFHEEWKDAASLEQHRTTPHVLAFLEQAKPVLNGDIVICHTQKLA